MAPSKNKKKQTVQTTLSGLNFFTPASGKRSSPSRKRAALPATRTQRYDSGIAESTRNKGKRKENIDVSPSVSPQTTPKKRKLQRALGSETNLRLADDSLTPRQGESSKTSTDADSSKNIIYLTDSPSPVRISRIGLPTPVTDLKQRLAPAAEPTPTPTHGPVHDTHRFRHTNLHPYKSPATPQVLFPPKEVRQLPTPRSPLRPEQDPEMLPTYLLSPSCRRTPSLSPPPSPVPGDPDWEEWQMAKPAPQQVVPSSQTQDVNPFLDGVASEPTDTVLKLPSVPSRVQMPKSPSHRAMSIPGSSGTAFKLSISPASTLPFKTPSHSVGEVVPTSQVGEEELVFFSPLKPPRTPTGLYIYSLANALVFNHRNEISQALRSRM
jgi:hypothetical protein